MADQSTDLQEKLREDYEASLFRLVMSNAAEKEGKLLLEEKKELQNDSGSVPSPQSIKAFERKMTSQLRKTKLRKSRRSALGIIRKAAVFLLVIAAVFSTAMATVQAFRIQVMNFLIDIQPGYTSFQINEAPSGSKGEKLTVNWTNTYLPTYIPAGYTPDSFTYTEPLKEIYYTNSQNKKSFIDYSEYDSSNNVEIDTENAPVLKTIYINGHKGTLVVKNSVTSVIWEMDRHIFTIQTSEKEATAIRIAQNVIFKKE